MTASCSAPAASSPTPRTGGDRIASYPWHLALDEAEHLASAKIARS